MSITINKKPAYLLEALEENPRVFEEALIVEGLCKGILNQMEDSSINRCEIKIAALYRNIGLLVTGTNPDVKTYKMHPEISAAVLEPFGYSGPIRKIISQHHERMDGTGYPNGLKEEDIIDASKILITVDAFNEMVYGGDINNMPILEERYKDEEYIETVLNIMKSTKKFDIEYVSYLEKHLREEGFLK